MSTATDASGTTAIMAGLQALRDALACLPGVATCAIGLEADLCPADYPMIRIVPSELKPSGPLGCARMQVEALIYFGQPIQPFDDEPDAAGRTRLQKRYAALLAMDESIREVVNHQAGQVMETIMDEDRLETYKLMALRVRLLG